MPIRYTDLDSVTSGARDFVIRHRTPTIPQLLAIFLIAIAIAVSITMTTIDKVAVVMILVILLGAVGGYMVMELQSSRDLVLATEFQNTLFTSALGINNKFCLIIRRDGTIVYLDRSFQELFPDFIKQSKRSVDTLLEYAKVSSDESKKIFTAIERGVYDKVIFNVRAADSQFHKIVMTVEPILRPNGFILLRGREYIETRSDGKTIVSKNTSPLNKSTIALFSHVMDAMDIGVYMTDPAGNIVYATPILEQWLGFNEGEITFGTVSLQDIIYQGGSRPDFIQPDNFEGEIAMKKKTGGHIKAFINQKVIRDDGGHSIGCTAIIHNMIEQNRDNEKKLW